MERLREKDGLVRLEIDKMVNAELGTTWCENEMNIVAMKHALMIQKKISYF